MIIFLGIIVELATIIGNVAIVFNASCDFILEILKNGYKIDKNMLDEAQKKQVEEKMQKSNLAKRVLGNILFFVPGVSSIVISIECAKHKKNIMKDPQIKQIIVPMTEEEKEQYAKMESKLQKLAFVQKIYKAEYYKITHTYEETMEEEKQGKTFTAYPYTTRDDIQVNFENVIQENEQSYIDDGIKVNLDLEAQSRFEQDILSIEDKKNLIETHQEPRLVRTLHPQNNKE